MGSIERMQTLDNEVAKVKHILGGERCHICGKEIVLKRGITSPFENQQGLGFIHISMIGHIKSHVRKWEAEYVANSPLQGQ